MIEDKFSEKIISKIEKDKLKPRPRWEFVFKNYFLWTIGILSLFFGAISFSLIIYLFNFGGDIFTNRFGASFWEVFLAVVPIFWLVFLVLFVLLFYLNLKKTKKAYKHSPLLILIVGLVSSIALGSSFYMLGFSKKLDSLLGRNVNPMVYGRFMNPQLDFWSEPEKGRLSGIISELDEDKKFFLVDKNSDKWLVSYDESDFKHLVDLEKGLPIRCFGEKKEDNQFKAFRIMPMNFANDFFERPRIRKQIDDPFFKPRIEPRRQIMKRCYFDDNCFFQ